MTFRLEPLHQTSHIVPSQCALTLEVFLATLRVGSGDVQEGC